MIDKTIDFNDLSTGVDVGRSFIVGQSLDYWLLRRLVPTLIASHAAITLTYSTVSRRPHRRPTASASRSKLPIVDVMHDETIGLDSRLFRWAIASLSRLLARHCNQLPLWCHCGTCSLADWLERFTTLTADFPSSFAVLSYYVIVRRPARLMCWVTHLCCANY